LYALDFSDIWIKLSFHASFNSTECDIQAVSVTSNKIYTAKSPRQTVMHQFYFQWDLLRFFHTCRLLGTVKEKGIKDQRDVMWWDNNKWQT